MKTRDRQLGMDADISRRDFLNGVALGTALAVTPAQLLAQESSQSSTFAPEMTPGYNPSSLTGMRGSHDGSFEVAHAVSLEGESFDWPSELTD